DPRGGRAGGPRGRRGHARGGARGAPGRAGRAPGRPRRLTAAAWLAAPGRQPAVITWKVASEGSAAYAIRPPCALAARSAASAPAVITSPGASTGMPGG